jgi:hypothetical protein
MNEFDVARNTYLEIRKSIKIIENIKNDIWDKEYMDDINNLLSSVVMILETSIEMSFRLSKKFDK